MRDMDPTSQHERWGQEDEMAFIAGLGTFNMGKRALSGDRRRELLAKYRRSLIRRDVSTLGNIDRQICLQFSYAVL